MNKPNDGGSIFPTEGTRHAVQAPGIPGISFRNQIALDVMREIIAADVETSVGEIDAVASVSYSFADAMIKEQATVREKDVLKLFVWTGFSPDHSSGLAFAIAPDQETAAALVIEDRGYDAEDWGELTIHEIEPIAKSVSGGM